jgi:hypothetical protein
MFYQNVIDMRKIADVNCPQSIADVSTVSPLGDFQDIHGTKGEVIRLFCPHHTGFIHGIRKFALKSLCRENNSPYL